MTAGRIILHVDMDSFFASIEVRRNPSLAGRPVIVGADPKGGAGRGVVSTCSYEARRYGVHSGMPISRAYDLCPHGVYLPVDRPLYSRVSGGIMALLSRHAGRIEQVSAGTRKHSAFSQAPDLSVRRTLQGRNSICTSLPNRRVCWKETNMPVPCRNCTANR